MKRKPGMRIGFITDEISDDVQQAIQTGLAWGIRDYELRVIHGSRVPVIADDTVDWLRDQIHSCGIRITALSPGIFKASFAHIETLQNELENVLPASLRLAEKLDCHLIIIFGFQRLPQDSENNRKRILDFFHKAATAAAPFGITLAVENEPGFWCDTGSNTAALLSELNLSNLRANWDPANAYGTNELPFPDGYQSIRPFIANMHIKDTPNNALSECVPVGDGKINWPGQLRAVVKDHILDVVTIETHCHPLQENSAINLQRVKTILGRLAALPA